MTVTQTPREILIQPPGLSPEDFVRASLLAKALQGRFAPAYNGWWFRPSYARKWTLLFNHGWSAVLRRSDTNVSRRFRRPDGAEVSLRAAIRELSP